MVLGRVLDMGNLIRTWMVLNMHESTNTTDVITSSNDDSGTILTFDNLVNFTGLKVQLDGVVLIDFWVGETESSSVVGHNVRNLVLAKTLSLDLAELKAGFLTVNADWLEASFDVVENAESLVCLFDGDNILEAKWEPWVSSDLVVNFDEAFSLSADSDRVLAGERVLKSVLEKHGQRNALT